MLTAAWVFQVKLFACMIIVDRFYIGASKPPLSALGEDKPSFYSSRLLFN